MPADIASVVSPGAVGPSTTVISPVLGNLLFSMGGTRAPSIPNAIGPSENISIGAGKVGAQWASGYRGDNGINHPVGHEEFSFGVAGGTGSAPVMVGTFVVTEFDCEDFTVNWGSIDSGKIIDALVLGEQSEVAIGHFELPPGTGNHAVTGLGFQPDLMFFVHHGRAGDDTGVAASLHMFTLGVADGTRQYCFDTSQSFTGIANANNRRQTRNDAVLSGGLSLSLKVSLASFDADGFTLNRIAGVPSPSLGVAYVAIRDPELVFEVGQFNQGATSVAFNDTHTEPPDALYFFGGLNTALNTYQDDSKYLNGWATRQGEQRLRFGCGKDNVNNMTEANGYFDNACVGSCSGFQVEEYRAAIDDITDTGFTLTNISDDGTDRIVCYVTLTGREVTEGPCARPRGFSFAELV